MPSPKLKSADKSAEKSAEKSADKTGAVKLADRASDKNGDTSAFLGASFKQSKPADAWFHVLLAPFVGERFKGSNMGNGPAAIVAASQQLESWDGRSVPARHGIHTQTIDCKGATEKVMEKIAAQVSTVIKQEKFPVGLGGDGLVTYGMVKGLLDAGVENFGVIQIDAQADLRDSDNGNQWSEACVMKRVVDEDVPLFQLGVRQLSKEEADARRVYGVKFYDADFLVSRNITKVELPGEFPEKVFLSIDIDGFDPSVFPSPGAVPGGLGWVQVLSIIESISQQAEIIGFDLTEYSPVNGLPFYDNAAALLVYKVMGIVERARL
ncbi:MAG: arginase family protein [Pseudomonadota bacterium]|nr:arginase family protein [Pseudomonadota bacterium]